MTRSKTFLPILLLLLAGILVTFTACKQAPEPVNEDLLLHVGFDEGEAFELADLTGQLPAVELSYVFEKAIYKGSEEPEWREEGIKNGALLFDGNSTFATYNRSAITLEGPELSISVWIAPRMFEWDDPKAAEAGTAKLTGILSQSSKAKNEGLILGYQRHGRLSFQVGTGSDWLEIWTNGDNLKSLAWNQVTATFSASKEEMCLFLNGELVASRSVPKDSAIQGADSIGLVIGRNNEGERFDAGFLNVVSGYLDELLVSNVSLAKEDVRAQYEAVEIPAIPYEEIGLQNLLTDDIYRPQFHAGPLQNWMNEPHAPLYHEGKYHLFFQHNMAGAYWRNISWGHWVSDDMAAWEQIEDALVPTENSVAPDGVWSGAATKDSNGVPLLFFTAGNDSFRDDGLLSNQNIGVAYPADPTDLNLTDWEMAPELALEQQPGEGRAGQFRDPFIWKENESWYMTICSGNTKNSGGTVLLYSTDVLELQADGEILMDWQYHGTVYEMETAPAQFGTSWELPIIVPIANESKSVETYLFIFSPAPASTADNKIFYFLGDFDHESGAFIPDESFSNEPKVLDYGDNVFTGPSMLYDEDTGRAVLFSIMQGQRSGAEEGLAGWAHTAGLAREVILSEDGTELRLRPVKELRNLDAETLIDLEAVTLAQANEALASLDEDLYRLEVAFDLTGLEDVGGSLGVELKSDGDKDRTTLSYDPAAGVIYGNTQNRGKGAKRAEVSGDFTPEGSSLTLDIFVDRSLVEAFFNNDKAISMRAYVKEPTSTGILLFSEGGDLEILSLKVTRLTSIFG